ncbi:MAG: hypothetical protein ACPLUL_11570 [Thermanaerothrix sp.]|uniref:hypothetical protein n=1 Tax=Thermanaerothrix sp. TaxID=2972675 RepID=UPI003C7C56AB
MTRNHNSKRVGIWIFIIATLYFIAFIFPNLRGAKSERMLLATSLDEPITYPHVVRMLTPAKDFKDLFSRWIIYGDYHYGYPFYFFSALAVLPVRLIHGGEFINYTAVNLLLLRQFISVLPLIIAILLLIYEQTKFKTFWEAMGLTIFMFSVPAFVRNNIQWWHPDALSVLSVTLVFVFLRRDEFKFGRYFWLAAIACGISVGIKLAGAFFFVTIPYYLFMAYRLGKITKVGLIKKGALFVVVALLALVVSNPFLYNAGARQELLRIQMEKVEVLRNGYEDGSPYYQKGPAFWGWTLSTWYGHPLFLIFLGISLIVGCLWGSNKLLNRLILSYIVPHAIYLLWFVAVKPDHYWLPIMIPLFSTAMSIPSALVNDRFTKFFKPSWLRKAFIVLSLIILGIQAVIFLVRPYSGVLAQYQRGLQIEVTLESR